MLFVCITCIFNFLAVEKYLLAFAISFYFNTLSYAPPTNFYSEKLEPL